ncbi:MAG: hypothetical protein CL844_00330 [Crocinitomicaceae bacterium]|nr:hypothetical protein [Crocinitomicaceae bacterium]|tara:strand:- start:90 stop:584 length:495 start_codon:yes stop_codon:yes gene_type:complete
MNKLLLIFIILSLLFSCKNNKSDYEKNLNHFKNLIKEINNYFVDPSKDSLKISNYYTEDFIFYSYPAGNKKGIKTSKNKYISELKQMKKMNISINIGHSIYLPGIDKKTYKLNGSVRVYYGATISIDTKNIDFSGYQTVDFRDGKISGIWEWADYGGVSNGLMK